MSNFYGKIHLLRNFWRKKLFLKKKLTCVHLTLFQDADEDEMMGTTTADDAEVEYIRNITENHTVEGEYMKPQRSPDGIQGSNSCNVSIQTFVI